MCDINVIFLKYVSFIETTRNGTNYCFFQEFIPLFFLEKLHFVLFHFDVPNGCEILLNTKSISTTKIKCLYNEFSEPQTLDSINEYLSVNLKLDNITGVVSKVDSVSFRGVKSWTQLSWGNNTFVRSQNLLSDIYEFICNLKGAHPS